MQLLSYIEAMQTRVKKPLKSTQEQYKRDYDTNVCSTKAFNPGRIAYTDKPLLAASSVDSAGSLATTSLNKVIPKISGPFAIMIAQTNTFAIDEHFIYNSKSIDCATLAS